MAQSKIVAVVSMTLLWGPSRFRLAPLRKW
jgi:hypothetical protein